MRYIIVDDEQPSRDRLRILMKPHSDFICVGEAVNGIYAVELIETIRPEVVLLDIQMPGLDGFDVIQQIRLDHPPFYIFITAFDQYAIRAFEVAAIDYLVKPVSSERLNQSLRRLKEADRSLYQHQSNSIYEITTHVNRPLSRIPVRIGACIKLLPFSEIVYFTFDSGTVFVKTMTEIVPSHFESLKELEKRLKDQDFFRINRNYLINLMHLKEVVQFGHSRLRVRFKDKPASELDVSREQAKKLKILIGL